VFPVIQRVSCHDGFGFPGIGIAFPWWCSITSWQQGREGATSVTEFCHEKTRQDKLVKTSHRVSELVKQ